jgi:hypothetical protein
VRFSGVVFDEGRTSHATVEVGPGSLREVMTRRLGQCRMAGQGDRVAFGRALGIGARCGKVAPEAAGNNRRLRNRWRRGRSIADWVAESSDRTPG